MEADNDRLTTSLPRGGILSLGGDMEKPEPFAVDRPVPAYQRPGLVSARADPGLDWMIEIRTTTHSMRMIMTETTNRTRGVALLLLLTATIGLSHGCKKKTASPTKPVQSTNTDTPGAPAAEQPGSAMNTNQTLDAIERAWAKTHSFSAKIETFVAQAIGREGRTEGNGTYDMLNEGKKAKIRFYTANALYIAIPDKKDSDLRTAEFLYWVTDGTFLYQSTHQAPKHYVVTKTWYDEKDVLQVAGPALMHTLRNDRKLKRLEDVALQERPCYAIEATQTDGSRIERHYFDKETGIRIKFVEFDEQHEKFLEITLSEVKTDVEFEAEHFTLEIPEQAEFVDKTKK